MMAEKDDDLSSEKGVDYSQLRDYLKRGMWEEADRETSAVMLKAAGSEKSGWLRVEDIDNFPCVDLRTIDKLWVKYSEGRFGFSVQKRIYESLGGTREYDEKIWDAFGDRVGWCVNRNWWGLIQFNKQAKTGHLPVVGWVRLGWRGLFGLGCGLEVGGWFVSSLASRLVKFNL